MANVKANSDTPGRPHPERRIAAVFTAAPQPVQRGHRAHHRFPERWTISVTGIANAYSATLPSSKTTSRPAHHGLLLRLNGVGGLAAINAKIAGVPWPPSSKAAPDESVNVVTLVSERPYDRLPLAYVMQRQASWPAKSTTGQSDRSAAPTSCGSLDCAKYFARNIIEIRLKPCRPAQRPKTPDEGEYVSRPNVGITGAQA
ncbi:MAG: hypothetical protein ACLT98_14365 [Eggerthellaceae bacterium]